MNENIKIPLYFGASTEIFRRAETLRNNMTQAERMLWKELKNKQLDGYKFRRQHPLNKFIADFYCHEMKLIIELDGKIHNELEVAERDRGREEVIINFGVIVIRFKNEEVLANIENVITKNLTKTK